MTGDRGHEVQRVEDPDLPVRSLGHPGLGGEVDRRLWRTRLRTRRYEHWKLWHLARAERVRATPRNQRRIMITRMLGRVPLAGMAVSTDLSSQSRGERA